MLGPLSRVSNQLGRNVMLKSVRNGSHGGVPGEVGMARLIFQTLLFFQNLPFSIHSKSRLTFNFLWFFATGFGAPFLVVLHQLRKK